MKYIIYLISLLGLASAGIYFFVSIDNQAKEDSIDRLYFQEKILCMQAANGLEEYFKYYKQLLVFLGQNEAIAKNTPDGRQLLKNLYKAQSETILSITRVDSNMRIVYTYPEENSIGKDVSLQPHIKLAFRTHEPVLSNIFMSVQGFKTVALHVPVFDNGKFCGTLAVLFSFSEVSKRYIEKIAIGKSGYAVLINQDGLQLYSPISENIGKSVYEMMLKNKPIAQMTDKMRAGEEGKYSYFLGPDGVNGEKKYAYFAPIRIENVVWSICVTAPEEEALKHIAELRNRLSFLLLLILGGIVISVVLLVRRIFAYRREEIRRSADAIIGKVQKENERALALLGAAITGSPTGIVVVDAETLGVLTCNRAAIETFSFNREQAVGVDYDTFTSNVTIMNPNTLSVVSNEERSIIKAIRRGEVFVNQEFIIWHKDNSLNWVSANVSPVRDTEGIIIAGIVLVSDITNKKKDEESIRQSENRFRILFDSIKDSISLIKDSVFYDCNISTGQIFKINKDEFVGHSPAHFSPEFQPSGESSENLIHKYFDAVSKGEPQNFEWLHTRKNGEEFYAEVSLTRMEYSGEQMTISIVRDVTERKIQEARSKELEEQLIQAQKIESLGRLAGGIAHDINNMLTPIIGYSEVLLNELPEGDKRRSRLENIIKSVLSSRDMVRQLLAFARKQSLEFQTIDLSEVVEEFSRILKRTLRENISIKYKFQPGLRKILADKGQIEQIIMNLCINAQDAMPDGGHLFIQTENVSVEKDFELHGGVAIPSGDYVKVTVSDTGKGIEKEIQDKVFEPFFTTKGLGRGTGLGLATVHGIVNQHGGHIRVYSDLGKGTTFRIYFPAADHRDTSNEASTESDTIPRGKETLLVIEDDEQVRTMTVDLLASIGYKVLSAENGQETIQIIRDRGDAIDLILSDVILPDTNGKTLYDEISTIVPDKKVIFMSGYTTDVISHFNYLDADVNFIQKPFSLKDLAKKIRNVIDQ